MSTVVPSAQLTRGSSAYGRLLIGMFGAGFATFGQLFDAQAVIAGIAAREHVSSSTASIALSASTLGMALSVLVWAKIADRLGRKRAMTISIVIATAIGLIAPFLPGLPLFIAARFIGGAALGAVPAVAMAFITEAVAPTWVAVAAGTFVSGNSIGGIVGRLVAGLVGDSFGWQLGIEAVSIICVAAAVMFVVNTPSDTPSKSSPRAQIGLLGQLRNPALLIFLAQGFLLMGVFGAMYNYLGIRLTGSPFFVPSTIVSFLFLAYIAGTFAARTSAVWVRRIGITRTITFAIAAMIVGVVLTATNVLVLVAVGLLIFTFGCFTAHPIAGSQSAQQAVGSRAQAGALYQLAWLIGTALFGWLGGLVFDAAGWPALAVMLIALLVVAGLICGIGLARLSKRTETP